MSKGIKNKTAIIGMGCTKFGEHFDKSAEDLMVDAFKEAIIDAGIGEKHDSGCTVEHRLPRLALDRVLSSPQYLNCHTYL
jgi:acetyl-CoA acetyltransferase